MSETKDQLISRQLQQIVDDATDLCNAPLVLISLFDRETGYFHFRALGGKNKPLIMAAIKAGELIAGQGLLSYKHKADANAYIKEIVERQTLMITDIFSASENILPRPAVEAAQFLLKVKQIASLPIVTNGQMVGMAGFISQKEITPQDLKLMNTFANEIRLLLENIQLTSTLEEKVAARTGELEKALYAHELTETALKESENKLSFLSRAADNLLNFPAESDIYSFITKNIKMLVPDALAVAASEYDEHSGYLFARSILGPEKYLQPLIKLLGQDPLKMPYKVEECNWEQMLTGKLVEIKGGLEQLAVNIPAVIWGTIKRAFNIGKPYGIGIAWQGKILGDAVIVLPVGVELSNGSTIELFVRQAAVVLQRRRAEAALLASREAFYNIVEKSPIGILVVDQERKVCFINTNGEKLLDRKREEFIGQVFIPPLAGQHLPEIAIHLANGQPGTGAIDIVETSWEGEKAELITIIDITSRALAEAELGKKVEELEEFCKAVEGRELKMIELEKEIERLNKQGSGKKQ